MNGKRKRILTALGLLFVLMLPLPVLTGCGASSSAQALEALPDLVARAEVLNEYIWGQGAPLENDTAGASGKSVAQYERVAGDAPFTTLAALTEEILQVYSTEYCKIIMEIVLEGNDDVFPRYNEDEDGRLTCDVTNDGFVLSTKLDPSQARVKSSGFNRVKAAVPCTFQGEPDGDYIVTLVYENGAWKLDSPTY